MLDEQFTRSYSILDLEPGASWKELRGAYRALVKVWHPDRFQLEAERRQAEEKTKEITRAYKTLADYYRKHGQTPGAGNSGHASAERFSTAQTPAGQATDWTDTVQTSKDTKAYRPASNTARHSLHWKTPTALIVTVFLFYLWLLDAPDNHEPNSSEFPGNLASDVSQAGSTGNAGPQPSVRFFTRGDKIGDVYSVQGIPSKTENGIWYYGKSKVYFTDGIVTRWDSHPDNPLNASLEIEQTIRSKEYFTRGNTKAEVLAIQGAPWLEAEQEWTYGSSRVFFSDGLVTGWEESPQHPLKARR